MSLRWAFCGVGSSAAAIVAAAACAQGQGDIDLGGGGSVTDPDGGSASDGARVPGRDAGGGDDEPDGSVPDGSKSEDCPPPSGCTGKVVISELMARGPSGAGDEFVELYNPNTCAVPLGGWKLAYKSKTGTGNTVLHTFEAGDSIAGGAFLVLGTPSFSPKKDATMNRGMADEGQVGLLDDGQVLVDAVGYGTTSGPYIEGTPTSGPPATGSVGRPCGVDTDDNAADFKAYPEHSAGAPNP